MPYPEIKNTRTMTTWQSELNVGMLRILLDGIDDDAPVSVTVSPAMDQRERATVSFRAG